MLPEENGQTLLIVDMDDFAQIAEAQKYYDASVEFANAATIKIKEVAES